MLTSMDIRNHEFEKGFRGYNEEQVNEFMNQVANEFETLYRDNRELKEAVDQLRDENTRYKNMEETMTNTLMLAQKTAEEAKVNARREAELIISSAEQEKDKMIQNTAQYLRDGQERYEVIRHDVAIFKAKIESLLKSQLQLLDGMELPECRECNVLDPMPGQASETVVAEETEQ